MYTDQEREIFTFEKWVLGEKKTVRADPQVLHRRMLRALGSDDAKALFERINLQPPENATAEDVRNTDAITFAALERALEVARATLDLKPLDEDGNGATEREQFAAFLQLLDYLHGAKKKGENSPTPSASGESPSPPAAA